MFIYTCHFTKLKKKIIGKFKKQLANFEDYDYLMYT